MGKVNVLGVQVDQLEVADVLNKIESTISSGQRAIICHAHIMGLNLAYEQPWFREFLNSADLVYCDGTGVKLGAALLGASLPERFTLADWYYPLAGFAQERDYSFYLLGNPPGTAKRAADRLCELYPRLRILGVQHGYFDKTPGSTENTAIVAEINRVCPDILFIGFGMPAQEKWLKENWERLDVHIGFPVGAAFEYVAGELKRGPKWMTDNYLEWVARIFISPRRYIGRYMYDNPVFLYRVLKQRFTGIDHAQV